MALARIFLRPVLIGEGRKARWFWKITREIGDVVNHVVYGTKPEAKRGLKTVIDDAIASGFGVEATSLDQTEQGFRAAYDTSGAMIDHQVIREGAVLGPRCSDLPRTPEAAKERRLAVRAKKKALIAEVAEAAPPKPPRKPRRPKPPVPVEVTPPKVPTPVPPRVPTPVPPKVPTPVAPLKPDGRRQQSPGAAAALAAHRAEVRAYMATHGVGYRDAEKAVKALRVGGAPVVAPKPPSAPPPRPATPRVLTPRPVTPPPSRPATPRVPTPVAAPRTPPTSRPVPAAIVAPPDDEAAEAAKLKRMLEIMGLD